MERGERPAPDYTTFLEAYDRSVRKFQADPSPANLALLQTGEEILIRELLKPSRFELGQMAATPGALETLRRGLHVAPEFLLRHNHGDWGNVDEEDKKANEQALLSGSRLLSAYTTRTSERLWVITEWD